MASFLGASTGARSRASLTACERRESTQVQVQEVWRVLLLQAQQDSTVNFKGNSL